MKPRGEKGVGALALMEEAFHLVRCSPLRLLAAYYIGSLPFVLGLLYFWADMRRDAFAEQRCAAGALGLAVLFLWMKCWQTVYARSLLTVRRNEEPLRWSLRRSVRMAVTQTLIQPFGLVALPVALLAAIPFGWAYAFYQNATVLGDGAEGPLRAVTKQAASLARLWVKQNLFVIWTLSPILMVLAAVLFCVLVPVAASLTPDYAEFHIYVYAVFYGALLSVLSPLGVVLTLNLAAAVLIIPHLLALLLGVETPFTQGGIALLDTTLFTMTCGLSYLVMDPLMKAVYVLRCFYGESVQTGEDLKVELRTFQRERSALRTGVVLALLLGATAFAGAQEADESPAPVAAPQPVVVSPLSVVPDSLDGAIGEVLQQREYTWRMPRRPSMETAEKGLLAQMIEAVSRKLIEWFHYVGRFLRKIGRLLEELFERTPEDEARHARRTWMDVWRPILYLALAGLACVVAVLSWRLWQRRRQTRSAPIATLPTAQPDLLDETTLASALPEDEWLTLARALMDQGEYRVALRALFLATLAYLARQEFIRVARFKSNRDYQSELARRAHAAATVQEVFAEQVVQFEQVWYGTHEATRDAVERFARSRERMAAGAS